MSGAIVGSAMFDKLSHRYRFNSRILACLMIPASLGMIPLLAVVDSVSIEGRVTDGLTGLPVDGAGISLVPCDGRPPSALATNADGVFVYREIEPGCYRVFATGKGYLSAGSGGTMHLRRGERRSAVDFRLERGSVLAGRVLDEDSEPVADAKVIVLRAQYGAGFRQLRPAGAADVDEQGGYRIANIAPGRYLLYTWAPSLGRVPADEETGAYAPGYYFPGADRLDSAVEVEVRPRGEVHGIDFRLTRSRGVALAGKVIPAMSLKRPIRVYLVPAEWVAYYAASVQVPARGGPFRFPSVAPGKYRLVASAERTIAEATVELGTQGLEDAELRLDPLASCLVRVTAEEPEKLVFGKLGVALAVSDAYRPPTLHGSSVQPNLNADGEVHLTPARGRPAYVSLAGLPDAVYVKSAHYGDADLLEEVFQAPRDAACHIGIGLSSKASQATGVVRNEDGEPVPAATVVMIPEFRRRNTFRFVRWTTTDENGSYRIGSLEPGEYKVYAWTDVEPHRWNDPEFLRPYLSKGERVKVEPEAVKSVGLTALN
ncbi:MAG: carboxypeptidase regulatory-like domain-containing protein [Bryobacterales bacterium]|nr:carboxypeptidase regulatory-like domain-containing protein [Bryobacterales bacterium]